MLYDWYNLFNLTEFMATELASRTIEPNLLQYGVTPFLVSRGNTVSLLYGEDVFLPINFLGHNPYAVPGYAVYVDENEDVWFGFEVPE